MNQRWVITDVHLNTMSGRVTVSAGTVDNAMTFTLDEPETAHQYVVGHELVVSAAPAPAL